MTNNLYLIPTAEVPVTNMFRDVILNENELFLLQPTRTCRRSRFLRMYVD
jgi:seryl-tRNA synthetase